MGAIYFPETKEMYFAEKGKGANMNGEKIVCSQTSELKDSIGLGHAFSKYIIPKMAELKERVHMNQLFCMGHHAAYVADGKYDWLISPGGKIWDYAASYIVLKESGCKVTHLDGTDWTIKGKGLVAVNPKLHEKIMRL